MIVAESYLRLPASLDRNVRRALAQELFSVAEAGAKEFFASYGTERIAEALVEDGSTKLWGRIRTSALAIVTVAGAYDGLRSGLERMWEDGRAAATWMAHRIEPVLPEQPDVRRRRAPAATRFKRLFDSVEAGQLSAGEATKRAERILREYRETPETIVRVIGALSPELYAIEPLVDTAPKLPEPDRPRPHSPAPVRAGQRIVVFRDPKSGRLIVVEE